MFVDIWDPYWKPSFSGSILNFGGVYLYIYFFFSKPTKNNKSFGDFFVCQAG